MRYLIPVFLFVSVMWGDAAQAFPRIIINNIYSAQPQLDLVNIRPQNHQEFSQSPPSVTVSFSLAIIPEKSDLKVFDPYNNPVPVKLEMPKDTGMTATLPPHLLAGAYRVEWKATCACITRHSINSTFFPRDSMNGTSYTYEPIDGTSSTHESVSGISYFTVY